MRVGALVDVTPSSIAPGEQILFGARNEKSTPEREEICPDCEEVCEEADDTPPAKDEGIAEPPGAEPDSMRAANDRTKRLPLPHEDHACIPGQGD